jgi:hypothetical protein
MVFIVDINICNISMANLWIMLSTHWQLDNFRAVLSVVIIVLSMIAIFTYSRYCWAINTAKIAKKRTAALITLLTLTSSSEVLEVVKFLKFQILKPRHVRIAIQCLMVLFFSLASILSGPIARFATREGSTVLPVNLNGLQATNKTGCMAVSAMVLWNTTEASLNRAGFPTDQLLDFLPDSNQHWQYKPDEWNSTYALSCENTQLTPLYDLYVAKNYSDNATIFDQIPGLRNVIPTQIQDSNFFWAYSSLRNEFWYFHSMREFQDQEVFIVYSLWPDYYESVMKSMSISIAAVHLHQVPTDPTDDNWRIGPIQRSSFTRAYCNISQVRANDGTYAALPNQNEEQTYCFAKALSEYYSYNWGLGLWGENPRIPNPDELIRFYQTYTINKDTAFPEAITRLISVQLSTVELSTPFLAVLGLLAVFIILGLAKYFYSSLLHAKARRIASSIPHSKLDWTLQAIREAQRSGSWTTSSNSSIFSTRLTADLEKKVTKTEFDAAIFSCDDQSPAPTERVQEKIW